MIFQFITKKNRKQADSRLGMAACVLCCLILAGCQGTDKAIILAGESVTETDGSNASDAKSREIDQEPAGGSEKESPGWIFVHVCGAVEMPGVVRLPEGSRACDALQAAGGFADGAAESFVNLAEPLKDGMQLYFPGEGEALELQEAEQAAKSGLVNINTADAALLCTLPGIGASKAADIVSYRETCGGFQTPEDIMQVPGIKEGAYAKIKDKITIQ